MHVAAFICELQHFQNLKPSYLNTCKRVISLILSDQVTHIVAWPNNCFSTNNNTLYCSCHIIHNKNCSARVEMLIEIPMSIYHIIT